MRLILRLLVGASLLWGGCGTTSPNPSPSRNSSQPASSPASRLGLAPACGRWLGVEIAALYCEGRQDGAPRGSLEPGHGTKAAVRLQGPGWNAGSLDTIAQASGAPLAPGGSLRVTAARATRGRLVVTAARDDRAVVYLSFQLTLTAGEQVTLTYTRAASPLQLVLVHSATGQRDRPDRLTVVAFAHSKPPSSGAAPVGAYQDCSQIGRPIETSDAVGDVMPNIGQGPSPGFDRIDLTRVRLAIRGSTLCANLVMRGPARPPIGFTLELRALGRGDSGNALGINAGVDSAGKTGISLAYPGADTRADQGAITGRLGIRGNRVSLVITRRSLPAWTPFTSFQWDVRTLAQNGPSVQVSDCAPDGRNLLFPSGRRAPARTAGHCTP
jgi:hypothetical protein